MKHLKDRITQAKSMYESSLKLTKETSVEDKLESMAKFLNPNTTSERDQESQKRQNHYNKLNKQQKEADYETDWLSVKSVNSKDVNTTYLYTQEKINKQKQEQQAEQQKQQQQQMNREDYYNQQNQQKRQETNTNSFTESEQQAQNQQSQNIYEQMQQQQEQHIKQKQQQEQQQNQQQQQQVNKENEDDDSNLSMQEKLRRRFMGETKEAQDAKNYVNAKTASVAQTAHIPFMITRNMKLSLIQLGYTIDDIKNMKPVEAHDILTQKAFKQMKEENK